MLAAIIQYLPETERRAAIGLVVEANRDVPGGENYRGQLLERIAPWWPEPNRKDVLALTHDLADSGRREVMTAVVGRLPADERPVVFRELLALVPSVGDGEAQALAAARLFPHLAPRHG